MAVWSPPSAFVRISAMVWFIAAMVISATASWAALSCCAELIAESCDSSSCARVSEPSFAFERVFVSAVRTCTRPSYAASLSWSAECIALSCDSLASIPLATFSLPSLLSCSCAICRWSSSTAFDVESLFSPRLLILAVSSFCTWTSRSISTCRERSASSSTASSSRWRCRSLIAYSPRSFSPRRSSRSSSRSFSLRSACASILFASRAIALMFLRAMLTAARLIPASLSSGLRLWVWRNRRWRSIAARISHSFLFISLSIFPSCCRIMRSVSSAIRLAARCLGVRPSPRSARRTLVRPTVLSSSASRRSISPSMLPSRWSNAVAGLPGCSTSS
mmetsp:Transcript_11651/g.24502  ORF Transcript_11651/g.24502 Transcript_11651/m.24502 type:complete len:334 (-) Transcript_11651:1491-2492(-)